MRKKYKKIPELTEAQLERFWSYVDKRSDDECWEWMNSTPRGYGQIKINYIAYRSHRVSYRLHYHIDPKDKLVCHTCDNPGCMNPKHLFLGSNQDNVNDCVAKNRHTKGEMVSKFTEKQVIKIYNLKGQMKRDEIAKKFNTKIATVVDIQTGRNWQWLTKHDISTNKTGKLTKQQVLNIRKNRHKYKIQEWADKYNVSHSCICGVIYHKTWKDIV